MTLEELKQQLQAQLDAAETAEDAARANLRRAELRSAFVRGQLAGLNSIQIEERPAYTEGAEPPPEPDAPPKPPGTFLEG